MALHWGIAKNYGCILIFFAFNFNRMASIYIRVPTQIGKMGMHFSVREFWTDWKSRGKSHNLILTVWPAFTSGFPLRLEKWECIFQSGNFEQTGKVRENHTKYWKIQGISDNETLKKYWKNGKKYWKSQSILSVRKSANHVHYSYKLDITYRPV